MRPERRSMGARRVLVGACAVMGLHAFASAANEVIQPAVGQRPTPVFLIILDELPRSSLLDENGGIDADAYPNLARLADASTRYVATTTVGTRIMDAVPAILSGLLPGPEARSAIAAEYPETLFTWLGEDYRPNVLEVESALFAAGRSRTTQEKQVFSMANDRQEDTTEHRAFRNFVRRIGPTERRARAAGQGSLHVAHVRLPRFPWHLVPSGTSYRPYRHFGLRSDVWQSEPAWSDDGWRRHLLQLQFVDALIGEFLMAVEKAGIYDEAVIVLTADYGTAFWPGESRRALKHLPQHPEDLVHVPLWIKAAGQSTGQVVERPVQTIDIAPTVLDLVGVSTPAGLDGCSLIDEKCAPLEVRSVMYRGPQGRRSIAQFPLNLTERNETLQRRLERIGSGREPERLYAHGPYADWVGQPVSSLRASEGLSEAPAGSVRPHRQWLRAGQGARGPRVVFHVKLDAPPMATPWVAVVREGVIETIVPAPEDFRGQRMLLAMIPERPELSSDGALRFFLVEGESAQDARFRPLPSRGS